MTTSPSYTSIRGKTLRESERAVLFNVMEISGAPIDPPHSHWFPISRMQKRVTNPNADDQDTMMVESWLIDKFCENIGI